MSEDSRSADVLEEVYQEPWVPSPPLCGSLKWGVRAVVLTSALSGAASIAALSAGPQPGFTLGHGLAWAALLPALWVVHAYDKLGEELGSQGLRKSVACLFGVGVLAQVYELATLGLFVKWAQVALWVVFALGMIVLPFIAFDKDDDPPGEPAATEGEASTAAATAGAGLLGGLGVLVVGFFKVFAKVAFLKGMLNALWQKWDWAIVAAAAVFLVGSSCLIWFAIMKIRLRRQLGGVAALLGWAEILGYVLCVAVVLTFAVQLALAADQPGVGAAELAALEKKFLHDATLVELGATVTWASLTVWLFASLRRRYRPDPDLLS